MLFSETTSDRFILMSNSRSPGNSLRNATSVGFSFETTLRDRIGAANRHDFFRFRVSDVRSLFRARMSGSLQNAGFRLLDRNGQLLKTSTRSGARSQSIRVELNPGQYYIQVFSRNSRSNAYQLKLFKDEFLCGCGDDANDGDQERTMTARSLFQ